MKTSPARWASTCVTTSCWLSLSAPHSAAWRALFGAFQGFVSPESFTLQESIAVLAMVVLGGMGHIPGVILGAVLLTALPELLRSQAAPVQQALFGEVLIDPEVLRQLFYGLALVLVMLLRLRASGPRVIKERKHEPVKRTPYVEALRRPDGGR
jgi:ABC-type branched-subunit amino acid transport system permease subunit